MARVALTQPASHLWPRRVPRRGGNFCKRFRETLFDLRCDGDKVFAVADKNLGLAAVDKSVYVTEALKWLHKTHVQVQDDAATVLTKTIDALKAVAFNTSMIGNYHERMINAGLHSGARRL